jgi:hypothetical protein
MVLGKVITQEDAVIILVSILVYMCIHLSFEYQENETICHVEHNYPNTIELFLFAQILLFYSNMILQLSRLACIQTEEEKIKPILGKVYSITASVSAFAGTSAANQFWGKYGGICSDKFDVYIPLTVWAEWLVVVPLMTYLSISSSRPIDFKLVSVHYKCVFGMFLCILFGFIPSFVNVITKSTEIVFLILSSGSFLYCWRLAIFGFSQNPSTAKLLPLADELKSILTDQLINKILKMNHIS